MNNSLPLNTSKFDELTIATIICEPVLNAGGSLRDYRIVFGNEAFARLWRDFGHVEDFFGALIVESGLAGNENLTSSHAFLMTLRRRELLVHFQPMNELPAPYVGFFLTNVSEYEKSSAREHFLRSIRQMESASILMRENIGGRLEVIFVSKNFARLMECSVDEALKLLNGRGVIAFTHPDDRLAVKRMLRRRVSEDSTKDLTIRQITTRGNFVWCNVNYTFIDDFGEHYVYCTYFDVTSLKVYAQRLQTTYMAVGDNFYRANEKTLSMFRVNLTRDKVEDIQGKDLFGTDSVIRPYSELINLRAKNYPIAEERENFLATFNRDNIKARFLRGETQLSMYLFSRRKDGHYCYVHYRAVFTRHPISNEIIIFIAEQEAGKEKVEGALLEKILARQFDLVAYIANEKYTVVVGDVTLIGKGSIFPLTHEGVYEEYLRNQVFPVLEGDHEFKKNLREALSLEVVKKNLKQAEPYVVNFACRIGGEVFYKRLDFYSIDPRADFFILLKSDTTEIQRKQIEQNERLKAALTEAEQANVAKTAFLSRMSHEIRTPMNAIIGLDNIALHEKDLSPTVKKHLDQIGTSARYLLSIINDILDMSRIESGRMTFRNEEFSFPSFVEQITTLVKGQCQSKGLTFDCETRGSIGKYYIGDDTKLEQVLINILGNAVKFTDTGGKVSLLIECTAQYDGQSNFRFTIKDTGIGMSKDYLPKIFEPFTQEDDTTTSRYGGSGLGMAITRNIVQMMNGSIVVESEKGVGSEFTVNVPLKDSLRSDDENSEEMRPQDFSVLIVDDEQLARDHAKSVLEEVGVSSETCASAKEALELIQLRHARREDYNLILVDWLMPEQDGIELTREIRKILGNDTAVIVLTAYDWFEVEDDAIKAGVDTFMAKPLNAANVLYEFQQAFHRKKQILPEKKLAALEGRKILVVEDMPVNAEIMMMILEMRGMFSDMAENGKIAVDKFAASPPKLYDAILMDIRMPVMDGLAAAAAIRELDHPDAKTVPIIAMTANAFDEDVQRSLKAGMNAHLTKPVDPEQLYKTLQELIRD
ncbi:MAG: response regulator [Selenomonadaceae bacterium]|nr:response regulator [Selenomonadaceae bacterium]